MKTNRQSQITGNHQKWLIGSLTVLLTGVGGTWYLNRDSEPATTDYQQTASVSRSKPVDTPMLTPHIPRPVKNLGRKPGTVRVVRERDADNKTERKHPRRRPDKGVIKDEIKPAA